jgi:hypothetical protein
MRALWQRSGSWLLRRIYYHSLVLRQADEEKEGRKEIRRIFKEN